MMFAQPNPKDGSNGREPDPVDISLRRNKILTDAKDRFVEFGLKLCTRPVSLRAAKDAVSAMGVPAWISARLSTFLPVAFGSSARASSSSARPSRSTVKPAMATMPHYAGR
jgi:hypothetical protein